MAAHKFSYKWYLKDGYPAKGIEKHGCNVFGTFICGGGSTMGYKLAGYNHLGGVEIDPPIADVYKTNHNPKYLFLEDIRAFNQREDLPAELYDLDLLDGSPPCSSFSMAGNREKDWGKDKVFREGQAHQRLDDLVFVYIETIKKLQPKVALLENVKGLITGNAKAYVKKMKAEIEKAGYQVQIFLLNAASMGVPQKRERVFFICQRNDLKLPKLEMNFNEKGISFGEVIKENIENDEFLNHSKMYSEYWNSAKVGETVGLFNASCKRLNPADVCYTVGAQGGYNHFHHAECRQISRFETSMIGSFPIDYNFKNIKWHYLIGMSVPPVMTAQIAHQIWLQWLSKTTPIIP